MKRKSEHLQKLMDVLMEKEIEAFLVTNLVNLSWLVGYASEGDLLLVFPEKSIYLALPISYEYAKRKVISSKVVKYKTLATLKEILYEKQVRVVGFEATHLSVSRMQQFRRELNHVRLFPEKEVIENLRIIKDGEEIKRLKKSARLADRAIVHILRFVKPGVEEKWLADEMDAFIRSEGGERPSFEICVASGKNTSFAHYKTGNRRLSKNDIVVMDLGCVYKGYCSDLTRTVFLGKITTKQREIYSTVVSAQESAITTIKPGRKCADLDARARKIIELSGYGKYFVHTTGHGVGMEVHEKPSISAEDKTPLLPGVVFTIEPGIYLPSRFGVRIEDMVLVTDNGYEILTHAPKVQTL